MLARRAFLRASVVPIVLRGVTPFVALSVHREANAFGPAIMAGIAIAGAIANFMASNGSSGVGAELDATLGYQRLIASELDTIQRSLQSLYDAVMKQRAEFRQAIHSDRLESYRNFLLSAVGVYIQMVSSAGGYESFQRWATENRAQLQWCQNTIRFGLNQMTGAGDYSAEAAFGLPAATHALIAISAALGEPGIARRRIAETADAVIAKMQDASITGSVANELRESEQSLASSLNALRLKGVNIPDVIPSTGWEQMVVCGTGASGALIGDYTSLRMVEQRSTFFELPFRCRLAQDPAAIVQIRVYEADDDLVVRFGPLDPTLPGPLKWFTTAGADLERRKLDVLTNDTFGIRAVRAVVADIRDQIPQANLAVAKIAKCVAGYEMLVRLKQSLTRASNYHNV